MKKILITLSTAVFVFSLQTMTASAQFTDVYSGSYYTPLTSTIFNDVYSNYSSYTNPVVTPYNYTSPAVSNYTSPTFTDVYSGSSPYLPYTSPTVTPYNYTSPTVTPYNYTSPSVSSYVTPTYNYPASTYNYPSLYNYGSAVVPMSTYGGAALSISYANQNQTCWNGTVVPVGTACPAQTQTCPNGTVIPIGSVCPNLTQTCWNGTVIPTNQACPAQYQTCPNGSVILTNQVCPANYIYNPIYTNTTPIVYTQPTYYTQPAPQTITVNNVVTGIPTQITDTSARCNGIGLIANNLSSTGWFEYGETSSLGRTTQTINIGTNNTSPFSNVLANLKPNTTYYCRAGMSNSYGTVRGDIVNFITKSKPVTYVKQTPVVTPITYTVKTPVKKSTVICVNEGVTLDEGQKAVTLLLEKTRGDLTLNGDITYTLSYKNISSSNLRDVVVKIAIPQELTFTSVTTGSYNDITRTVTANLGTLGALSEGSISLTANVSGKSQIGKTIVTTGYVVYTIDDSSKIVSTQDEVTTYILGTIMSEAGAKKIIGQDNGISFLPSTLIEWIALLAIIFILMVLGRSIYTSYKEDRKKK